VRDLEAETDRLKEELREQQEVFWHWNRLD
jgi:hypothetical protein